MADVFDSDLASAPSNHNVRVIENHEDYRQITQELRIQIRFRHAVLLACRLQLSR